MSPSPGALMNRHTLSSLAAIAIPLFATAASRPLRAQSKTQPQAQAKYTAVYSSDTLDLLSPALSPDRRWVAFTARPAKGDMRRLMVIASSGGTPTPLTGADQSV